MSSFLKILLAASLMLCPIAFTREVNLAYHAGSFTCTATYTRPRYSAQINVPNTAHVTASASTIATILGTVNVPPQHNNRARCRRNVSR